ncbi:MAG: hypothetical protein K0Q67_1345 [Cellvibrio sp.]|nr:hypothetical protein [Cellvibrio sp.]
MFYNIIFLRIIFLLALPSLCQGNERYKKEESIVAGFRAGNSSLPGYCKNEKN